jgi:hypothetical protein
LLEASAATTSGAKEHTVVTMFPTATGPVPIQHHLEDLPSYFSGGAGYVHKVGRASAVGIAGELGFSNSPETGNAHRLAVTVRARHWTSNVVFDLGAGPLGAEIFTPAANGSSSNDRIVARGATLEAAVTYKSLGGVVVGGDAIHGGNRGSSAIHVGFRTGSYGTLAAAAVAAVLEGVTAVRLARGY